MVSTGKEGASRTIFQMHFRFDIGSMCIQTVLSSMHDCMRTYTNIIHVSSPVAVCSQGQAYCSCGLNVIREKKKKRLTVNSSRWMWQWCSVAAPWFMLVWTQKSLACLASVRPPTRPSLPGAGCCPGLYVTLCQLAAACRSGQNLYLQMDSTYNWPWTHTHN